MPHYLGPLPLTVDHSGTQAIRELRHTLFICCRNGRLMHQQWPFIYGRKVIIVGEKGFHQEILGERYFRN